MPTDRSNTRLSWRHRALLAGALLAGLTAHSSWASELELQAVQALRTDMRDAAQRKDRDALQALLSADFVFVHSTGKTNNRSERVDSLLTGNAMETQPPEQLAIQVLDDRTAVARGQTRVTPRTGDSFLLHWNAVYTLKDAKSKWQAAYVQSWRAAP